MDTTDHRKLALETLSVI